MRIFDFFNLGKTVRKSKESLMRRSCTQLKRNRRRLEVVESNIKKRFRLDNFRKKSLLLTRHHEVSWVFSITRFGHTCPCFSPLSYADSIVTNGTFITGTSHD